MLFAGRSSLGLVHTYPDSGKGTNVMPRPIFFPPSVQDKAIPLALEGKDVLARAKTGSGKTGAYVTIMLRAYRLYEKRTCI